MNETIVKHLNCGKDAKETIRQFDGKYRETFKELTEFQQRTLKYLQMKFLVFSRFILIQFQLMIQLQKSSLVGKIHVIQL